MDQILDGFSTPSQVLSRTNDFAAWQINSSILGRLRSIKWSRSIYELRKHSAGQNFPVYYRTYSRRVEIKEEGTSSCKTFASVLCNFFFTDLVLLKLGNLKIWNDLKVSLFPLVTIRKEYRLCTRDSLSADCGGCSTYLVGNTYWRPDKLTKPICFVVDNANWSIRFSLLSTPLVHALCLGSKDLLQAI
jgi:hypothetical protein